MSSCLIPTHRVATWVLTQIERVMTQLGIPQNGAVEEVIYTLVVFGAAAALGWCVRKVVVIVVRRRVYSRRTAITAEMQSEHIVGKVSHIIPPLVILALIPWAFRVGSHTVGLIERAVLVYFMVALGWTICAALNVIWVNYDLKENTKNLPLRGIVNVAKGLVWIVVTIITVSIIVDRSPATLLAGLGAFAAALMLIFKDSILGFVAGIQLSLNDMLRVGDWIAVPGTIADGIVTDVSLTAVKVRNWDNTTVTLPPYTLVSTSFQNWNKMKARGRRQIEYSVLIDINTVCPTTAEMLEKFKSYPHMKQYIEQMQADEAAGVASCLAHGAVEVNGTTSTNLGCFRAYIGLYLRHHPYVALGGPTCMVRLMPQTPQGLPVQVFCYVNTIVWTEFEGLQSDIVEHIIAMAPAFGLSAYSSPTGRDVVNVANPHPQGMPYYGTAAVATDTYAPMTNFMVPPNTSGDQGFAYTTTTVYPASIADAEAAAKAAGEPVRPQDSAAP